MNELKKYIYYLFNILKSFLYDIRLFFFDNIKQRAQACSYDSYRTNKQYPGYLKYGAAIEGVRYLAKKYCIGEGLDIGAGFWPLESAKVIENNEDENAYKLNHNDSSVDYIFTSHLLEHLHRPKEALEEWARVLKPGDGTLFIYLPHPACTMWEPKNLSAHVWMPDPLIIEEMLDKSGFNIIKISYLPDGMMSYYIIAKRKCK